MWHNEFVIENGEIRHLKAMWTSCLNAESNPQIRQKKEISNKSTRDFLRDLFEDYPKSEVLDLGAIPNDSQLYIPKDYWSRTTSVDWTIDKEDDKSLKRNLNDKLLIDKKFDIVVSKETYGCLKNPDSFFDDAVEVLNPRGLIILIDFVGLKGKLVGDDIGRFSVFEPEKIEEQMKDRGIINTRIVTIDKGLGIGRLGGLCDLVAVVGQKK